MMPIEKLSRSAGFGLHIFALCRRSSSQSLKSWRRGIEGARSWWLACPPCGAFRQYLPLLQNVNTTAHPYVTFPAFTRLFIAPARSPQDNLSRLFCVSEPSRIILARHAESLHSCHIRQSNFLLDTSKLLRHTPHKKPDCLAVWPDNSHEQVMSPRVS